MVSISLRHLMRRGIRVRLCAPFYPMVCLTYPKLLWWQVTLPPNVLTNIGWTYCLMRAIGFICWPPIRLRQRPSTAERQTQSLRPFQNDSGR
jgi:hypothetical protein